MRVGRGAIWRERGQIFPVPLTLQIRHSPPRFCCVRRARSVPYVARTGSGRRTPYLAAPDKKRLWRNFLSGASQIPLGGALEDAAGDALKAKTGPKNLKRPDFLRSWRSVRVHLTRRLRKLHYLKEETGNNWKLEKMM
jgi:hypothetical protein